MTDWQKQRSERSARLKAGSHYASGKMVPPDKAKALLEAIIRPGDRVCLEGDNQKQADAPALWRNSALWSDSGHGWNAEKGAVLQGSNLGHVRPSIWTASAPLQK